MIGTAGLSDLDRHRWADNVLYLALGRVSDLLGKAPQRAPRAVKSPTGDPLLLTRGYAAQGIAHAAIS